MLNEQKKLVSKLEIAGAPQQLTVFTSEYGSRGSGYDAIYETIRDFQGCSSNYMRQWRTVVYVYAEWVGAMDDEEHGMPGGIGI